MKQQRFTLSRLKCFIAVQDATVNYKKEIEGDLTTLQK
jgi:hypothetical protein